MQYLLMIYRNEQELMAMGQAEMTAMIAGIRRIHEIDHSRRPIQGGRPAEIRDHGLDGSGAQRQNSDHGRPVRGDARAARRVLPGRGQESRRGLGNGRPYSGSEGGQHRGAAHLGARHLTDGICRGRRRGGLSPGGGSGACDPDPPSRRLRLGGRGAAGCVRRGARAVASSRLSRRIPARG